MRWDIRDIATAVGYVPAGGAEEGESDCGGESGEEGLTAEVVPLTKKRKATEEVVPLTKKKALRPCDVIRNGRDRWKRRFEL